MRSNTLATWDKRSYLTRHIGKVREIFLYVPRKTARLCASMTKCRALATDEYIAKFTGLGAYSMSRSFTPKVVTANALLEGDVVYLAPNDTWTRRLDHAEFLTDEAYAQLRLVEASARQDEVVGVYLADASAGSDGPEAVHFREHFRAQGPSNYAHGKQQVL